MSMDYRDVLDRLMHDMRSFNKIIKSSAEVLLRDISEGKTDRRRIEGLARDVYETAFLLSNRLTLVDYEVNPAHFSSYKPIPISIYGKFHKALLAFRRQAGFAGVKLEIVGASYGKIDGYPVIEVLPYLLLENAVKYAPKGTEAIVRFAETPRKIQVAVESVGPLVEDDELALIIENGVRGKNAAASAVEGSGLGLSLAQSICELHRAKLSVRSFGNVFSNEGVPYRQFEAAVEFQRQP